MIFDTAILSTQSLFLCAPFYLQDGQQQATQFLLLPVYAKASAFNA
ncbi:MAG: hypothetical protein Q7T40_10250 [Methylobacter sp.]|nr:hypothetical protein [Methylobacter sp.]